MFDYIANSKPLDEPLSKYEMAVVFICFGEGPEPGSFVKALIDAIVKADIINLAKLRHVFPEYVNAYLGWSCGNLEQRRAYHANRGAPDRFVCKKNPGSRRHIFEHETAVHICKYCGEVFSHPDYVQATN